MPLPVGDLTLTSFSLVTLIILAAFKFFSDQLARHHLKEYTIELE